LSGVYKIPFFDGEPQFDRLPVWKLCCDRSTPPNERIFAQAQIARNRTHLYIRIWTFEPNPSPDVLLSALISRGHHLLAATASVGGDFSLMADGMRSASHADAYLFSGEDLQGVYAGAVMKVAIEEIYRTLAADGDKPDTDIIDVNLLRVGTSQASVSSLVPVGSSREMSL